MGGQACCRWVGKYDIHLGNTWGKPGAKQLLDLVDRFPPGFARGNARWKPGGEARKPGKSLAFPLVESSCDSFPPGVSPGKSQVETRWRGRAHLVFTWWKPGAEFPTSAPGFPLVFPGCRLAATWWMSGVPGFPLVDCGFPDRQPGRPTFTRGKSGGDGIHLVKSRSYVMLSTEDREKC